MSAGCMSLVCDTHTHTCTHSTSSSHRYTTLCLDLASEVTISDELILVKARYDFWVWQYSKWACSTERVSSPSIGDLYVRDPMAKVYSNILKQNDPSNDFITVEVCVHYLLLFGCCCLCLCWSYKRDLLYPLLSSSRSSTIPTCCQRTRCLLICLLGLG